MKFLGLLFAIIMVVTAVSAGDDIPQIMDLDVTWSEAVNSCSTNGGRLPTYVEMESLVENQVITIDLSTGSDELQAEWLYEQYMSFHNEQPKTWYETYSWVTTDMELLGREDPPTRDIGYRCFPEEVSPILGWTTVSFEDANNLCSSDSLRLPTYEEVTSMYEANPSIAPRGVGEWTQGDGSTFIYWDESGKATSVPYNGNAMDRIYYRCVGG